MTLTTPVPANARVAAYLRVSTGRQAEAELSIPDQRRQAEAFCAARGWTLCAVFEDAGASGTDEDRPEFQRMIEAATGPGHPLDVVLVHSTSRFARDLYVSEHYIRRLRRARVEFVFITQDIAGGDGTAEVFRQMLAVFDQYQSRENAKHTHRAMRENARQGFWNGSRPPFGYCTVEAGRRGHRVKKVLAIDEAEATLARRIFALHLGAEGVPLGTKAIAAKLNSEGERLRGRRFSISNVHRILTAETYAGQHWFDRVNAKSGERKPRDQWVAVEVPPIVARADFERVQESLAARAPNRSHPRVISSPVLLTGIAQCATCGGGMTLRTGKSGRYRYYTCASAAHRGKAVCPGRSVPMDDLDQLVIGAFAERILRPERLEALLSAYIARSAEADPGRRERLARLKKEATEAAGAKTRLMKLVASGALEADDPDLIEQLKEADARRRRAEEEIGLLEAQAGAAGPKVITPAKIAKLATAIRSALETDAPEFRRAYLRLFVGRVTVGDEEIRISGPTATLARASAQSPQEILQAGSSHFHRVWRRKRNREGTLSGAGASGRVPT